MAPKRHQTPPKDNLATLQGTLKNSTLKSLPRSYLQPQEKLLGHPQVRILLTISDFGCLGACLGHGGAPDERRPPLDGAGACRGLRQPGRPFAHLRVRGVPVEIRLQLRAAGKRARWKWDMSEGATSTSMSTDSSVGVSEGFGRRS